METYYDIHTALPHVSSVNADVATSIIQLNILPKIALPDGNITEWRSFHDNFDLIN